MMSFISLTRMVGRAAATRCAAGGGIITPVEAATVTRPQPADQRSTTAIPPRGDRDLTPAAEHGRDLIRPALGTLLVVTFLLRIWGIKQGLPYSYNVDEATHFVPRAIGFFGHDLNPHYFLNPPAYSYLLHLVFELWFGSADAVTRTYTTDPTALFVLARVLAATLGTVAVWLTYLAGERFFNRAAGLLAAAILG